MRSSTQRKHAHARVVKELRESEGQADVSPFDPVCFCRARRSGVLLAVSIPRLISGTDTVASNGRGCQLAESSCAADFLAATLGRADCDACKRADGRYGCSERVCDAESNAAPNAADCCAECAAANRRHPDQ